MSYILFFLLATFRFEKKDSEKLIVLLGIFFIIIFLFTFAIYPKILFGQIDQHDETRGFQRIRTDGIGYLFLLSFFSLSEYILKRKALMLLSLFAYTSVYHNVAYTNLYYIFSVIFIIFYIEKKQYFHNLVSNYNCSSRFLRHYTKTNFYKLMAEETTLTNCRSKK